MDTQAHWEQIYGSTTAGQRSWYQPHLETSLAWIEDAARDRSASIIDVGGGESTLADDLLASGYRSVTVLDLSGAAMDQCRDRLGAAAASIRWVVGDVTSVDLPACTYDVWHDRAVFHFLTEPEQRSAYLRQVTSALKPGGQLVMATFGPEGPQSCSGLETRRYDAEALLREMAPAFRLVRSAVVEHQTPRGITQQFLYCHFSFDRP